MNDRNRILSRRVLLRNALVLGGLAIPLPAGLLAQQTEHPPTPEQAMGPFYPVIKPLEDDADLTFIKGRPGHAEGKVIHLMGRITNEKGEPVSGARMELWQANTRGRYAHPGDINPAPLDPNFQGYGVQITDQEGRYHFKTIKPGAYPINPLNPTNQRPPHIHFDIIGNSDRLVTQMYFPGEPLNELDFIFKELGSAKHAAICKILPPTKEFEPDSLIALWDVVLYKG